jgi:hypothetical protein
VDLATLRPTPDRPGLLTFWYHADRSYSTDKVVPVKVPRDQHRFFQEFLDKQEARDTDELKNAGINNVSAVASKIVERYGEGCIRLPEVKGDGYFAIVRTLPPK